MIRVLAVAMVGTLGACISVTSVGSDTSASTSDSTASSSSSSSDASSSSEASDSTASSDSTGAPAPEETCLDIGSGAPYPDACMPAQDDTICEVCIKLSCCAALLMCDSYEACVCLLSCAETGASPAVCNDACGSDDGGCDLGGCGEVECADACGG